MFFPLYTHLEKDVKSKKKMTIQSVEDLGKDIDEINMSDDDNAKEIIYLLIISHAMDTNETLNEHSLPYSGINDENTIVWENIHSFPHKLLFILEAFIKRHNDAGLSKDFDPDD